MRYWLSFRGPFGTRPGISLGREDFRRGRLPSWRKYEYRKALKAYAEKHGEHLTDEDANYKIDRAVAMGELDAGGPTLHIVGSRDEIVTQIVERGEAWGMPVTRAEAENITDKAIRKIRAWRILKWVFWGAVVTVLIAIAVSFGGNP